MTMTVDEAPKYVEMRTRSSSPEDEMLRVFAAEVERLQKVVADQALTIGVLKDENAALKENASAMLYHEALRLKREAQTARLELDAALERRTATPAARSKHRSKS